MTYLSRILLLKFSLCLILQEIILLQVKSAPLPVSCDNNYIRQQSVAAECVRYMRRRSSPLSSFPKSNYQIVQTHENIQDTDYEEYVAAQILGLHPPHYNSRLNSYPTDANSFNYESNYARYKRYDENKISIDKTQPFVFQFWPNADTNYNRFKRNLKLLIDKCCSDTGCTKNDFVEMCEFRRQY